MTPKQRRRAHMLLIKCTKEAARKVRHLKRYCMGMTLVAERKIFRREKLEQAAIRLNQNGWMRRRDYKVKPYMLSMSAAVRVLTHGR